MTDDELNKWIHKKVMGECIHKYSHHNGGWPVCGKCGKEYDPSNWLPAYTTDLNATAIAEANAITKVGELHLGVILELVINAGIQHVHFANARTRCEAMKLAMENVKCG